jgi:hypothetical protein
MAFGPNGETVVWTRFALVATAAESLTAGIFDFFSPPA